ncbi:hypothetical protein GPZ77_34505 (plasmid) [Streptomyces sp. QHH-9511]|nr:hypothetical protein [Streptomyces sp. QHH-9511]QGZ53344.1 hypothetical protein GPZ77_34505 [Streptomyces sp. QHH-9511]
MAIPTPAEFRTAHGDPTDWCGPEIDEYLDDCLAQLPNPTNPAPAMPAAA